MRRVCDTHIYWCTYFARNIPPKPTSINQKRYVHIHYVLGLIELRYCLVADQSILASSIGDLPARRLRCEHKGRLAR